MKLILYRVWATLRRLFIHKLEPDTSTLGLLLGEMDFSSEQDIWGTAPFVIDSICSSVGPLDNEDEARALADLLHVTPTGEHVYWDGGFNSFGLICGINNSAIKSISRRLPAPWLSQKGSGSSILMFHASNRTSNFNQQSCYLLDIDPQARIFVSPRTSNTSTVYGRSAQPLRVREEDIGLRHVLALCTPPSDLQGRGRIMTTIQYVLSQMEERFDLKKFIELVNEEKWTEEGETFMALRQTLLTALISSDDEDPLLQNFHMGETVLIDLSDPILSSTEMDGPLFALVFEKFLRFRPSHFRSMIVLDSCQEYLKNNAILAKTLEFCLQNKSTSTPSMLFTTSDPTTLPVALLQQLDFIFSGYLPSPTWHQLIEHHFVQGGGKEVASLRRDQTVLLSLTSMLVRSENDCRPWDHRSLRMTLKEILPSRFSVANVSAKQFDDSMSTLASNPILDSEIDLNIPPVSPTLLRNSHENGEEREKDEPSASFEQKMAYSVTVTDEREFPLEIDRMVTADQYPEEYRILVEAILQRTGGRCNSFVNRDTLGDACGGKPILIPLGWSSFKSLVDSALAAGIIKQHPTFTHNAKMKWLSLQAPMQEFSDVTTNEVIWSKGLSTGSTAPCNPDEERDSVVEWVDVKNDNIAPTTGSIGDNQGEISSTEPSLSSMDISLEALTGIVTTPESGRSNFVLTDVAATYREPLPENQKVATNGVATKTSPPVHRQSAIVTTYHYPSEHEALIDAILIASGSRCEVPVPSSSVAGYFADKNTVNGLWWSNFSTLVTSASKDEIIEETQEVVGNGIKIKYLTLRAPKQEWSEANAFNHMDFTSTSPPVESSRSAPEHKQSISQVNLAPNASILVPALTGKPKKKLDVNSLFQKPQEFHQPSQNSTLASIAHSEQLPTAPPAPQSHLHHWNGVTGPTIIPHSPSLDSALPNEITRSPPGPPGAGGIGSPRTAPITIPAPIPPPPTTTAISIDAFPRPYRILVESILKLSNGQFGHYIRISDIANACGEKKKVLKPLGWKDAEELVKAAERVGYVVCTRKKNKIKSVALKQRT